MPDNRLEVPLDLSPLIEAIEKPLALIEPADRTAIQNYLTTAHVHLERAVYDFLLAVAAGIDGSGADLQARVEYRATGPCLVLEATSEPETGHEQPFVEGDLDKVTIRLPKELKEIIDRLAGGEGVSANSWYIRELARTTRHRVQRRVQAEWHEAAGSTLGGEPAPPAAPRRRNRRNSLKGFVGND